jgi:hypothetical protein
MNENMTKATRGGGRTKLSCSSSPRMTTSSTWQKFKKLTWSSTPSRGLPHGITGIVSVMLGMYLIAHSILGDLSPYHHQQQQQQQQQQCKGSSGLNEDTTTNNHNLPMALILYSFFTACNALAGAKLSHVAWKDTQRIFRQCAHLQQCLCYYILRFAPVFSHVLAFLQQRRSSLSEKKTMMMKWIHLADILMAIVLVLVTLSFQHVAYTQWVAHDKKAIAVAVSIGSFGLLLLSTYPIQLAIGGQEWWECIQQRYPEQNVGMVGYIYVPATVTFSLILFSATLYQRGILSDIQFGIGAATITLVCLIATVLSQELHIPFVSTQRIYLPCHEPMDDSSSSMEAYIVQALDFSVYARSFWRKVFQVDIVKEEQC